MGQRLVGLRGECAGQEGTGVEYELRTESDHELRTVSDHELRTGGVGRSSGARGLIMSCGRGECAGQAGHGVGPRVADGG